MHPSPIFTSEPMMTRALAAEIRHNPEQLQELLESRGTAEPFGALRRVQCEGAARVDILLEFERPDGTSQSVGIEAKFDHELTRTQIRSEVEAVDRLFVIVLNVDGVPAWLGDEFPQVPVVSWHDVLACFPGSRVTDNDLTSIRAPKASVEARFNGFRFQGRLEGWSIDTRRNGNGNPSIVFESPVLPDGRTLRGQIQVTGRGMPERAEDVRLESHMGISVVEDELNYFDPSSTSAVPAWIESLRTLQRAVLDGNEERLRISRRPPGMSTREFGRWKKPLAEEHLKEDAHLAKGYVDWAIGPKTAPVPLEQLEDLADITAEVFEGWFAAESA